MEIEHISKQTNLAFITEEQDNIEQVKGVRVMLKYRQADGIEYGNEWETAIKFKALGIGKLLVDYSGCIKLGKNAVYCQNTDHTFIIDVQPNHIEVTGFYWGIPDEENTREYDGKLTAKYGDE